jgi:molecular chaperone IbpA
MRGFDYSPFYRATVGFDRVFDLLDNVAGQTAGNGYPPYNIEKAGDNAYRIVMAVAGFAEAELNVTQKENELLVTGQTAPNARTASSTSIAASPAVTSSAASSSPTM